MSSWVLLETFTSEAEARVVESFLQAQGFEVQLLDTHMHRLLPAQGAGDFAGMRMLVRAEHAAAARDLLQSSRRSSHLRLVEEAPVIKRLRWPVWTAVLVLLVMALSLAHTFL